MPCSLKNNSIAKDSLAQLVADFLEQEGCCACDEMKDFQNIGIKDAIKKAARAKDSKGKLYSHQWNLEKKHPNVPKEAEHILVKCAGEIAACSDFDALHDLIIDKLKALTGAGEMYYYDTAFRIGISMDVYPQKVYLHCGTRDGAKALGVYEDRKEVLEMAGLLRKFPEFAKMKPYQVEDFLCMKKGLLHNYKRS